MTIASIDIGSNTVLMLIAEVNLQTNSIETIRNYYRVPRISQGLTHDKEITKDKINLLLKILEEYNSIIHSYKCENVLVAATNAFRIASNGKEIAELINKHFGWNVNIINGDEEARLSFIGAVYSMTEIENYKAVIDIGGGSTEIIYGSNQNIIFKKSYPIGIVYLTEKYLKKNIPTKGELNFVNKEINLVFNDLINYIPTQTNTIAVAGTPTTLSCIKQNIKIYNEKLVDNSILTINDIEKIITKISLMSSSEIKREFGQVVEGREDVLLAGSLILSSFMKILKLEKIIVSNKGLRYGLIIDFIDVLKN